MKKDIFELISPDEPDDIDRVSDEDSAIEKLKAEFSAMLARIDTKERKAHSEKLSDEMKEFIRSEVAKIKPVQKVIEKTIETKVMEPVHIEPKVVEAPPQIIRETRVEVQVPKKDDKVYAEASVIQAFKKEIEDLKAQLESVRRIAETPIVMGGSGVIGIPAPEGNEGKTLKVLNGKAIWQTVTGGSGASISGYTINDATTLKDLPADASLDDIRQVLGTLITELMA